MDQNSHIIYQRTVLEHIALSIKQKEKTVCHLALDLDRLLSYSQPNFTINISSWWKNRTTICVPMHACFTGIHIPYSEVAFFYSIGHNSNILWWWQNPMPHLILTVSIGAGEKTLSHPFSQSAGHNKLSVSSPVCITSPLGSGIVILIVVVLKRTPWFPPPLSYMNENSTAW